MLSPATSKTDAAITDIALDNVSGAAEILRRAASVFSSLRDELIHNASPDIDETQTLICKTCIALTKAQPNMSSLLRLASAALSAASRETAGGKAIEVAADAAREFVESATASAHAAAIHAVSLIRDGSKLLTHSRSSTVLEALIEAQRAGIQFEVFATESRPMLEGRKLASELSEKGIRITVIMDDAAPLFVGRADLVLVGADKITPEHLINKIGTKMIAVTAQTREVPMYSVCDTSKFVAADYFANLMQNQSSAGGLCRDSSERVVFENSYFEPTSLAYFTAVATERGILSSSETSVCARNAHIDPVLIAALQSPGDEIR